MPDLFNTIQHTVRHIKCLGSKNYFMPSFISKRSSKVPV